MLFNTGKFVILDYNLNTNTCRYAMDWNQAKKAWREQYITSFVDFNHLLSVCPVRHLEI